MTIFAVRGRVLRALRADPVWFKKALRCRSLEELQRVFVEFGRLKGFEVVELAAGKVDLEEPKEAVS
jgi:hypothetical protein